MIIGTASYILSYHLSAGVSTGGCQQSLLVGNQKLIAEFTKIVSVFWFTRSHSPFLNTVRTIYKHNQSQFLEPRLCINLQCTVSAETKNCMCRSLWRFERTREYSGCVSEVTDQIPALSLYQEEINQIWGFYNVKDLYCALWVMTTCCGLVGGCKHFRVKKLPLWSGLL